MIVPKIISSLCFSIEKDRTGKTPRRGALKDRSANTPPNIFRWYAFNRIDFELESKILLVVASKKNKLKRKDAIPVTWTIFNVTKSLYVLSFEIIVNIKQNDRKNMMQLFSCEIFTGSKRVFPQRWKKTKTKVATM